MADYTLLAPHVGSRSKVFLSVYKTAKSVLPTTKLCCYNHNFVMVVTTQIKEYVLIVI